MVLAELGTKISNALQKLNKAVVIDEAALEECLKEIATALLQADVNVKYVAKLRENIRIQFKMQADSGTNLRKLIQTSVVKELTKMLESDRKPFTPKKGKSNVIMFVGLQGSGKTTTCAKYAFHWKKKGWKTALVCADTFRAGAFDQLKQNATKIRVPFHGSYTETDPVQIAEEGVSHFKDERFDMIIVDTSGRHKQEQDLFNEMKQVEAHIKPDEIIFVMDSSIGQACYDQALAFRKAVNVGSVIITKLDGHAKGGGALSAVAATESPIIFIGLGERFDEFESFEAQSFIQRILGMGDIKKLFEVVKDAVNLEDQPKILEDIKSGKFTLRDLQSQFHSILKLGSLNQFMSMIPGLGTSILTKGNEQESIARIKRFLTMLDSMTSDELDGKFPLVQSRMTRIAKGSGTKLREVNDLIEEHKRLAKIVGKMGKMNLGQGNDLMSMKRHPGQMMKKMQNVVDPKMLQQLGGMGNIMNMMKEMGKMEGMGDLMKQFKKK